MVSIKQQKHLKKLNANQKGKNNRNYKGGYKLICIDGKYIFEHRYIMEKLMGRSLNKNEDIHHLNLNPTDNRIENLVVLTKSDHAKLHAILRRCKNRNV